MAVSWSFSFWWYYRFVCGVGNRLLFTLRQVDGHPTFLISSHSLVHITARANAYVLWEVRRSGVRIFPLRLSFHVNRFVVYFRYRACRSLIFALSHPWQDYSILVQGRARQRFSFHFPLSLFTYLLVQTVVHRDNAGSANVHLQGDDCNHLVRLFNQLSVSPFSVQVGCHRERQSYSRYRFHSLLHAHFHRYGPRLSEEVIACGAREVCLFVYQANYCCGLFFFGPNLKDRRVFRSHRSLVEFFRAPLARRVTNGFPFNEFSGAITRRARPIWVLPYKEVYRRVRVRHQDSGGQDLT